jgi:transketolase
MTELQRKVIDISYKYGLTHIGSCLNIVDYIDHVYSVKEKDDIFILSNGHAGLALYIVLEKYGLANVEDLITKHGTHPNRDIDNGIYCSTGSLGSGLPIAVGAAIANHKRNVYVTISDGECAEGSIWESLKIASDLRLENLRIACIANGYSAYGKVDLDALKMRLQTFYPILFLEFNLYDFPDWAQGLSAHYHKLTKETYAETIC